MSECAEILLREFGSYGPAIKYAQDISRRAEHTNPSMSAEYAQAATELQAYKERFA